MTKKTPREQAVEALTALAAMPETRPLMDPVGTYMGTLEAQNDRLARLLANNVTVLETAKRELMREGWVHAWNTINNDPDLISRDPNEVFNEAYPQPRADQTKD